MKKIIVLLITILIQVSQAIKIKSDSKAVEHFPDLLLQIRQRTSIKSRGKDLFKPTGYQIPMIPMNVSNEDLKEAQDVLSAQITNLTNLLAIIPPQGLTFDQLFGQTQQFSFPNTSIIYYKAWYPISWVVPFKQFQEMVLLLNQLDSDEQNLFKTIDYSSGMLDKQFLTSFFDLNLDYEKKLLSLSQSAIVPVKMNNSTADTIVSDLVSYFKNASANIPPQGYSIDAFVKIECQGYELNNWDAIEFLYRYIPQKSWYETLDNPIPGTHSNDYKVAQKLLCYTPLTYTKELQEMWLSIYDKDYQQKVLDLYIRGWSALLTSNQQ